MTAAATARRHLSRAIALLESSISWTSVASRWHAHRRRNRTARGFCTGHMRVTSCTSASTALAKHTTCAWHAHRGGRVRENHGLGIFIETKAAVIKYRFNVLDAYIGKVLHSLRPPPLHNYCAQTRSPRFEPERLVDHFRDRVPRAHLPYREALPRKETRCR